MPNNVTSEVEAQPPSSSTSFISIENVSMSFVFNATEFKALDTVNLSLRKGEFVTVIGPSGCGKSTLFSIVSGLSKPTTGTVKIEDEIIDRPRPDKLAIVLQETSLFPWRTVLTNVEFGVEIMGVPKQDREKKAQELIQLMGLSGFESKYPQQLSGGMRQRVSIARALALNSQVLLMGEPFASLDEQTRRLMGEELLNIWRTTGKTILFITHSLEEAVSLSDRIVVMSARPGRVLDVIDDNLPRPRNYASLDFGLLKERIWNLLKNESSRALVKSSI